MTKQSFTFLTLHKPKSAGVSLELCFAVQRQVVLLLRNLVHLKERRNRDGPALTRDCVLLWKVTQKCNVKHGENIFT